MSTQDGSQAQIMRLIDDHSIVGPVVQRDQSSISVEVETTEIYTRSPDAWEPAPPEARSTPPADREGVTPSDEATYRIRLAEPVIAALRAYRDRMNGSRKPARRKEAFDNVVRSIDSALLKAMNGRAALSTPTPPASPILGALVEAAQELLDACVEDMGYGDETGDFPDRDDEAVALSSKGPCAVQFGHLRRLREALKSARTADSDGDVVVPVIAGFEAYLKKCSRRWMNDEFLAFKAGMAFEKERRLAAAPVPQSLATTLGRDNLRDLESFLEPIAVGRPVFSGVINHVEAALLLELVRSALGSQSLATTEGGEGEDEPKDQARKDSAAVIAKHGSALREAVRGAALRTKSTTEGGEREALRKIAELRFSEAGEPFDEALDIADAILRNTPTTNETAPVGHGLQSFFGDRWDAMQGKWVPESVWIASSTTNETARPVAREDESLFSDALEILSVLRDEREEKIGEECEVVRDLIDRMQRAAIKPPLESGRAVDGWQDISTAPRDGDDVLLDIGGEIILARWLSTRCATPAGWYVSDGHTVHLLAAGTPVRWMPLPAPPSSLTVSTETRADLDGVR